MELRSTFDSVAELYDRARPTYPPELIAAVTALGPRILEIGPGTGQATRALVDRGADVTAVELGPNLAALARRNVPQAEIVVADFETWEPQPWAESPAEFDVVASFTAFHWLGPERYAKAARLGRALAVTEVDHVLVEGGDPFWFEVQEDYQAVLPSPDHRPPPYEHEVGDLSAQLEETGLFADIEVRRYRWDTDFTADEWVEVMRTYSPVISLDHEMRERLLDRVHARIGDRTIAHRMLATLNVGIRSGGRQT